MKEICYFKTLLELLEWIRSWVQRYWRLKNMFVSFDMRKCAGSHTLSVSFLSVCVCVSGALSGEKPATHIHPEATGVSRPWSHTQGEWCTSWFSSARGCAICFQGGHDWYSHHIHRQTQIQLKTQPGRIRSFAIIFCFQWTRTVVRLVMCEWCGSRMC